PRLPVVGSVDQTSQRPFVAVSADAPALLKKLPPDARTMASPAPLAVSGPFNVMSPASVCARSDATFAPPNARPFASTRFTAPALVTATLPRSFDGLTIETLPVPAANVSVP